MRKTFVVLALAAVAAGLTAAPATATHSWNGYHWARPSTAPFPLEVGNNVDSNLWTDSRDNRTYLSTATADWDISTVMDLASVTGGTTGRRCRATLGRVEVCSAAYGKNGWLGLATVSLSGVHITQGTAKVNDTYFNMAKYDNPNERLHVMCQEVGHDFGLGHTSETGLSEKTCMDYFSNTGANATNTESTHPNQHDYDQLALTWGHGDSSALATSTAKGKGPSMADREGTRPYKSERRDSRHFSILTERFSDGSIRITHYTWAN